MNLNEYIEKLKQFPMDFEFKCGLKNPGSWRGWYGQVYFRPWLGTFLTRDLIIEAQGIIGKTFTGYKGGKYLITPQTEIHVEDGSSQWTDGYRCFQWAMNVASDYGFSDLFDILTCMEQSDDLEGPVISILLDRIYTKGVRDGEISN